MKLKYSEIETHVAKLDKLVKKHKQEIKHLTHDSKYEFVESDIKDGYVYITICKRIKVK